MISTLHIFVFFSVLFSYAHCACQTPYFTNTSPCDTQATQIRCRGFTSRVVQAGQWQYFFIPLNHIEGNIELDFKLDSPVLNGYIRFQPEGQYQLPDTTTFDDRFEVQKGARELPSQILSHGMKDGNMLLGIYNKYAWNIEVQVRYFTTEGDCKRLNGLALGLFIGFCVLVAGLVGIVVGVCLHYRKRRASRRAGRQGGGVQNTELANQLKGFPHPETNGLKSIELKSYKNKESQETTSDFQI